MMRKKTDEQAWLHHGRLSGCTVVLSKKTFSYLVSRYLVRLLYLHMSSALQTDFHFVVRDLHPLIQAFSHMPALALEHVPITPFMSSIISSSVMLHH